MILSIGLLFIRKDKKRCSEIIGFRKEVLFSEHLFSVFMTPASPLGTGNAGSSFERPAERNVTAETGKKADIRNTKICSPKQIFCMMNAKSGQIFHNCLSCFLTEKAAKIIFIQVE